MKGYSTSHAYREVADLADMLGYDRFMDHWTESYFNARTKSAQMTALWATVAKLERKFKADCSRPAYWNRMTPYFAMVRDNMSILHRALAAG